MSLEQHPPHASAGARRRVIAGLAACFLIVGLSSVAPAQAAAPEPRLLGTIPFADAGGIATNVVTHTTYVANGMGPRMAIIDDQSGSVAFRAMGPCCGSYGMASDDVLGTLFIAGTDAGIYALNERTH